MMIMSMLRCLQGIGSKLMSKMGYVVGTGLGPDGEGRVDPVVAYVYPQGVSLGESSLFHLTSFGVVVTYIFFYGICCIFILLTFPSNDIEVYCQKARKLFLHIISSPNHQALIFRSVYGT